MWGRWREEQNMPSKSQMAFALVIEQADQRSWVLETTDCEREGEGNWASRFWINFV